MHDRIAFRYFLIKGLLFFKFIGSLVLFMCCVSVVSSCKPDDQQMGNELAYFDLKSFVEEEIAILDSKDPKVLKMLSADSRNETRESNGIRWGKELELFVQADINKPAYRSSYIIKQTDNLHYHYSLKKGERLPVQNLKITVDSISGKPAFIEATMHSENKLYHSEKKIILECKQVGSLWMVHSYHILGYQKLFMMNARNFEIKGLLKI